MDANVEEALRAKDIAEKRFAVKDFLGAKSYALKAKTLCPGLDGISQMVATFDVYVASEDKLNGGTNYYSVLGLEPSADKSKVKKQYKKMAVLLHPDKNKSVGADGAFKLVSEAWTVLSDGIKGSSREFKRHKQTASAVVHTNSSAVHGVGVTNFGHSNFSDSHGRPDSFWTVCTSCKVRYEYLRKYVNKRLSCKNCRGIFIAVETGTAPRDGSYYKWSYAPGNGYGSDGHYGPTNIPAAATCFTGSGVSGYHFGHKQEYGSNISFDWNSYSTTNMGVVGANGSSNISAETPYHANGDIGVAQAKVRSRSRGRPSLKNGLTNTGSNIYADATEASVYRTSWPDKKRKIIPGPSLGNGYDIKGEGTAILANVNSNVAGDLKQRCAGEVLARRSSGVPAFDVRKLLIEKAKSDICKKLEEMKLAAQVAIACKENGKAKAFGGQSKEPMETPQRLDLDTNRLLDQKRARPVPMIVPDSDFHDFDRNRSEECFKPKQIWALYDEDDGMPRLYCLIRDVISIKPFKVHISYLGSKSDSEFGTVNWLNCGFTKSCGSFRAWNLDIVDQVNVFSHILSREKAGRGGCVRIYPRNGDIWAMYRNWSPDWNQSTPDEERHQYEMVEVLEDYSEDHGVSVIPLIKLAGFKTVYGRTTNRDAIRRIPRRETLRFSHQVPFMLLKEDASNLPDLCWELDPAATPEELLNTETIAKASYED